MPNDIPLELIEKALALTGKTTEDMEEMYNAEYARDIDPDYRYRFSIEKFCYYLLSPEFIEKYVTQCEYPVYTDASIDHISKEFGWAIARYQKGNPEPLISLLSKI